jgi:hypothetical protein
VRLSILGVGLFTVVCAGAAFATTTDELAVCINGASCVTILDTAVTDPVFGAGGGQIDYTNSNFNGWNLKIIVGTSNSPNNVQPGLDLTSLTATCVAATGCGTNVLDVLYTDINFNVPVAAGAWNNQYSTTITKSGGTSGSTSQLAWVDTSNTLFGMPAAPGMLPTVGPFTTTNAATVSGGPTTGPFPVANPYSLTLEQTFTDNSKVSKAGITFSSDGSIDGTPVPEPLSIILLGTLLCFSTAAFRRRLPSTKDASK